MPVVQQRRLKTRHGRAILALQGLLVISADVFVGSWFARLRASALLLDFGGAGSQAAAGIRI